MNFDELERLVRLRDAGALNDEEFEQQKALLSAKEQMAPHPSADMEPAPEPGKHATKIVGTLLVLGACLAVIYFALGSNLFSTESQSPSTLEELRSEATLVTADELYQAYQRNEAAAQQEYGNKVLEVSGVVEAIELDAFDDPTIALHTSDMFGSVDAELAPRSHNAAANLSKGQNLVLLCTGVSEILSFPQLKNCTIVSHRVSARPAQEATTGFEPEEDVASTVPGLGATREEVGITAAMSLLGTTWEYEVDGTTMVTSIDISGNYITQDSDGSHVDHGTYVQKEAGDCFTSAMNNDGEECWTMAADVAIGATDTATSDKGNSGDFTRVKYRKLTM